MTQRKGVNTKMLDRLKNFDPERTDIDEAIALSAFARDLAGEYTTLNLDTPEWLTEKSATIRREIQVRTSELRSKRVKEIQSRLEALEDTSTKRERLKTELARLQANA